MRLTLILTCALAALLCDVAQARPRKHRVRTRRVLAQAAPATPPAVPAPAASLTPAAREGIRLAEEGCQSDGFDPGVCEKAIARLEEVARQDPNQTDVQLALSKAYWNSAYQEPETSRTRGELRQRSTAILQRLVEQRPNDARPVWELSLREKDEARQLPLLERTVKLNPKHPEAHKDLAEVLVDQGKADEAAKQYQRHMAVNPPKEREDTEQTLQFAQKLARVRPEAAAEVVDGAWKATREESRTERCLRFKDVNPGVYARKPALRAQVQQVQPYCTETEHLDRAVELEQQGRVDEAINELQRQVATNPKPEETYVLLERLQLKKGRPDLAAQAVQRELKQEPDTKEKCERFKQLAPDTVRAMPKPDVDSLRQDCGQP
jgi:tetratricopeptide (TPR) repeat protein